MLLGGKFLENLLNEMKLFREILKWKPIQYMNFVKIKFNTKPLQNFEPKFYQNAVKLAAQRVLEANKTFSRAIFHVWTSVALQFSYHKRKMKDLNKQFVSSNMFIRPLYSSHWVQIVFFSSLCFLFFFNNIVWDGKKCL